MQTEPDEDLKSLWKRVQDTDSLDYAFLRLGELDPERADLGAVDESDNAKIEAGQSWWKRKKVEVKNFVCQNPTLRKKGPVVLLQAIFGTLAQELGGAIATYATVILIKKQFGSAIDAFAKDALDQWCGDIRPPPAKRSTVTKRRGTRKRASKKKA